MTRPGASTLVFGTAQRSLRSLCGAFATRGIAKYRRLSLSKSRCWYRVYMSVYDVVLETGGLDRLGHRASTSSAQGLRQARPKGFDGLSHQGFG